MKRIARTLASALRRRPSLRTSAASKPVSSGAPAEDVLDLLRRSEAFAEDLADLVSRRPSVLAKRELRELRALR
jgi:hypothetical protein